MLYFFDGFDGYNAMSDFGLVQGVSISALQPNYLQSGGRFNGGRVRFNASGSGYMPFIRYILDLAQTTLVVGGSFIFSEINRDRSIIQFFNASFAGEVTINLNNLAGISVLRGATVIGSSANSIIAQGVWTRIEVRVIMDTNGSNGSVQIRVNGNVVLNLTGIDTTNTAITGYSGVSFVTNLINNTESHSLDDVTIVDGRTSANNDATDFLGDVRISQLLPTADAGPNDGTPSVAGAKYLMVDDSPGYNTGDYVDIVNTAGNQETYEIQDSGATSTTILGVRVTAVVTKTDASGANAALIVDSGGNVGEGPTIAPPSGSNQIFGTVFQRQPVTNNAWSKALVDALKIGYRVK